MEPTSILRIFQEHGVEYVVAGASAVWLHEPRLTPAPALEICYRQAWSNCECLARALDQERAQVLPPRPVPIPVTGDLRRSWEPIAVETPAGALVLLPTVPGLGSYDDLYGGATAVDKGDLRVPVLTLEQLRYCAAARPSPSLRRDQRLVLLDRLATLRTYLTALAELPGREDTPQSPGEVRDL